MTFESYLKLIVLHVVTFSVITVFWGGFVVEILWNWFMPGLHVQPITFWQAVGILALVNILTLRSGGTSSDEKSTEDLIKPYFDVLVGPAVILFIGWVAHTHLS